MLKNLPEINKMDKVFKFLLDLQIVSLKNYTWIKQERTESQLELNLKIKEKINIEKRMSIWLELINFLKYI